MCARQVGRCSSWPSRTPRAAGPATSRRRSWAAVSSYPASSRAAARRSWPGSSPSKPDRRVAAPRSRSGSSTPPTGSTGTGACSGGRGVGKQGNLAGVLHCDRDVALVLTAGAADPAGPDLASVAEETAQQPGVFVIDHRGLVLAERADLLLWCTVDLHSWHRGFAPGLVDFTRARLPKPRPSPGAGAPRAKS